MRSPSMDRTRFSFIAHRHLEFCSPVGAARVARTIGLMRLLPGAEIVDFGAGKCGWLAAIAGAVPGSRCTGVEPAAVFAQEAEERHAPLVASGTLCVVRAAARDFLAGAPQRRFDAALCIGSTHAFGDFAGAIRGAASCVRAGGVIVIGEGYWKRPPAPEYLAVLGGDESEFTSHAGNIRRAIELGLVPRWACTVTDDEWDEYEWGYSRGIESFVREHPDDPDAAAMLARSRAWRDAYVTWGRDTLGFGIYLLEVR